MSRGIIDTIIGGLEIAVGVLLELVPGGQYFGAFLIAAGVGMVLSGIGTLLAGNVGGIISASRNPVAPWNVVYGRALVGGIVVYINTFGDTDKFLDMVIVLAAHQSLSVDELRFDSQRVQIGAHNKSFSPTQQDIGIASIARQGNVVTVTLVADIPLVDDGDQLIIHDVTGDQTMNGKFPVTVLAHSPSLIFTYLSGGPAGSGTPGGCTTAWADYGNTVYMEAMLGDQALGQTFQGMLTGTFNGGDVVNPPDNPWTADCSLLGKTAVMLRLTYDSKVYASGIPQISFLVHGKNDIFDPRTGLAGYSENAALCIADYLSQKTWGFKANYGNEIPSAPLIAAANICDENVALASGGIEPRYACNGTFALSLKRGEILQNLLTSCAGRLTYIGGQFVIFPAAFSGVSATVTDSWLLSNATAGYRWRPTVSIRDLYNGVKGKYVSPSNNWTASDFPGYAQDGTHGYNGGPVALNYDENLFEDGGDRRWLDIQLPFTISAATAQRIAKIELLRRRHQGTGTFALNMAGYQFVPMDVIAASLNYFGWDGKYLEILATRFKLDNQQSGEGTVVVLGTEIDVQETDPSIYAWDIGEELSPQGYVQAIVPDNRTPAAPTNFKATPFQGIIVLSWDPPTDAFVLNGGHLELRYQLLVSPPGIYVSLGSADPSTTQLDVTGLVPLETYLFQIRSVNAAGVPSPWVSATAVFPEPSSAVWMPNLLAGPAGDPMYAPGDLTFTMRQIGSTATPAVEISGEDPVNAPASSAVPAIGSVSVNGTGGHLRADRTYFYALAVSNAGSAAVPTVADSVLLPGGPDTQQIVLSGIVWPPGTWDTWILYASIDREEMLCAQLTGDMTSPPTSITLDGPLVRATYGPSNPRIDHLRIKLKYLAHLGVVNGIITEVGPATGTGPLAAGFIRCMHLASDLTQDTDPNEAGVDWASAKDPVKLASDDWSSPPRWLSVLTHKVDGNCPILNFKVVAYDGTSGKSSVTPDPAALGVGKGDIFAVRFIPSWNANKNIFTDTGMLNGQYGTGTPASGLNSQARVIGGPGKGQISEVTAHDNISYTLAAPLVDVDETSIVIIEFRPWIDQGNGPTLSVGSRPILTTLDLSIAGFLERGLLVQVVTVDADDSEAPDELSPVREFVGFNDVSYGAGGTLTELVKWEFGRGSDGGPAAVAAGDQTALFEIDADCTLQGYSILNQGLPVGDSTWDIMRKPAGSAPATPYGSLLGANVITIPDGTHDTVIFSNEFGAGVTIDLKKGDIVYGICLSVGGTPPMSPVIRVYAGLPLATAIDGTQSNVNYPFAT